MSDIQALKATAKRSHARKPEDVKAAFVSERKIHECLKNRYIVQLENAFSDDSTYYLVL
jgi:mRNA-degrading endonuclease HigB of HigAB toxin-antitoxin module